jgi:glycerol-3-phosphate dehydrogenase (NAD(P)+)
MRLRIAVIGDGGWGTTLAILLNNKGYRVTLWGVFPEYVTYLNKYRINKRFLPQVRMPSAIEITANLQEAVCDKDLIILAVPSQYLRSVLKRIKREGFARKTIFLSAVKGIERGTLLRMSEVIRQVLKNVPMAVLSGPTIAKEVALSIPSTAIIASPQKALSSYLQGILTTPYFRIYTNTDVTGVELGGSLKNIIAIACGISDGLGFGTNTKAGLVCRGLTEISRLGRVLGAKKETFSGISGLGDLITTCFSPFSRNRHVGEQIGRGKVLKQIIPRMLMVAEGVATAKAVYQLSHRHKVDMPITRQVYLVLYKNKSPLKAVKTLMARRLKEE